MWQLNKNCLKGLLYGGIAATAAVTMLDAQAGQTDIAAQAAAPFLEAIAPAGKGGAASSAEVRTSAMMAEAAASMPQQTYEAVPFMPTDDFYLQEKDAANAMSQAALKAGADKSSAIGGAAAQLGPTPAVPATIRGVSFNGASQNGLVPPDTHGAAGPSHIVEAVNAQVAVYSKAGVLLKNTTLNAFFGLAATAFTFDPRVIYDQTWNRWVIVATRNTVAATNPGFFLAVSRTSDPTGSYYVYNNISYSGGPVVAGDWFDFPGLGMDQDAVLFTSNVFTAANAFRTTVMIPIAKARVYNGLGFSTPMFTGLAPTLQPPVVVPFDQNNNAYFVAANTSPNLHLYRGQNLSNPSQATLVLQALVPVAAYAAPPNAPQLGTTALIDTSDRRFINNSSQFGTSLWNVHTIALGGFSAPKFYEINTGTNTLKQSGFFFEGGTSFDFNASIVTNSLNEAFVTWNSTDVANATVANRHNARIRISGRQPADPLNTMSSGSALVTSAVALTGNGTTVQRWGDYSAVSLDPSVTRDPITGLVTCAANRRAWIINEKINSAATWGSQIARIGFCN